MNKTQRTVTSATNVEAFNDLDNDIDNKSPRLRSLPAGRGPRAGQFNWRTVQQSSIPGAKFAARQNLEECWYLSFQVSIKGILTKIKNEI